MTGCAGGLSGGLWAHGASLRPGADFVLDALDFDARLARADAVVSGEGRFDSQSLEGKIVGAIASRCAAAGKPLHLVVGAERLRGKLTCSDFFAQSGKQPAKKSRGRGRVLARAEP